MRVGIDRVVGHGDCTVFQGELAQRPHRGGGLDSGCRRRRDGGRTGCRGDGSCGRDGFTAEDAGEVGGLVGVDHQVGRGFIEVDFGDGGGERRRGGVDAANGQLVKCHEILALGTIDRGELVHRHIALETGDRAGQVGVARDGERAAGDAQVEQRLNVGRGTGQRQRGDFNLQVGGQRFAHRRAGDLDGPTILRQRGEFQQERGGGLGQGEVFYGYIEAAEAVLGGRGRGAVFEVDGQAGEGELSQLHLGQYGGRGCGRCASADRSGGGRRHGGGDG